MASADVTLTIRVRDMERTRLFLWELMQLRDRMIVEASPHAGALERVLERYTEGGDDDRPEVAE